MRRPAAATVVGCALLACCLTAAIAPRAAPAAAGSGMQHVTVIGDSVVDGINGDSDAQQILVGELSVDLEAAACRRLVTPSCTTDGVQPSTVLQLIHAMGSRLGPNVVIAVGYNDWEEEYAQGIEQVLAALKAAGVRQVWWLTLRETQSQYVDMNGDIEAAAAAHPSMHVIEWNVYSRSHPEWFQPDGVHLLPPGSEAMATLIHETLVQAGVAALPVQVVTADLPAARDGLPYAARLVAAAGIAPYRWSLLGPPPKGVHLEADGRVVGRPSAPPGTYVVQVHVADSGNAVAVREVTLPIDR